MLVQMAVVGMFEISLQVDTLVDLYLMMRWILSR